MQRLEVVFECSNQVESLLGETQMMMVERTMIGYVESTEQTLDLERLTVSIVLPIDIENDVLDSDQNHLDHHQRIEHD